MKPRRTEQPQSAIPADDVFQALERIMASKHFVNAHQKKKFLRVICNFYLDGRAHELNEHILGYDVFGRDSGYNPSEDPIVRVFAHEIRKKLETYYANEGANDPIRLEIPAGSYQPFFSYRAPIEVVGSFPATEVTTSETEVKPPRNRLWLGRLALSFALSCLSIAVISLALSNRQLRLQIAETESARAPSTYGAIWSSFLTDSNPPLVILSNPPALRVANPSDPEARTKDSIPLAPGVSCNKANSTMVNRVQEF